MFGESFTLAMAESLVPVEMIALGMIILAAQLGGRICRSLKLSEVTGQLLGGALVGPFALESLGLTARGGAYREALDAFHFFVFVFLGLVAFAIGEELHFSRLKKAGRAALVICLISAGLSWALISAGFYCVTNAKSLFGFAFPGVDVAPMPLWEAMLIGSIGVASAPAVAFVLMNQLRVEGRLRHVLGSLIVLSDLAGVFLFSLLLQVGRGELDDAQAGVHTQFVPLACNLGLAALLGVGIFVLLRLLVAHRAAGIGGEERHEETPERDFLHRLLAEHPSPSAEILLVVTGAVALGCGLAYLNHWPFLITAVVAGFMVSNFHSHAIFDSLKIDNIAPVFNLGFFALIGATISLDSLSPGVAILAGVYVAARFAGKSLGVRLGCLAMGEERKISACLPSLMLPQAGVAAVEAVYASAILGKPEIGAIVLPAIVFFEISGVMMVERSLKRWRSWVADEENALKDAPRSGAGEAARKLLSYLAVDFLEPDCAGAGKGEVIRSLVARARRYSQQHIDEEQALQVLGEREELSPTGFGNGIAIPHCRLMGLERPVLVLARHAQGVVFGGVDEEPCLLILLILSAARDPGEHLKLLAAAAHVLGDAASRRRLQEADSAAGMLAVLEELARD